jgi:hypothetical protein
MARPLKAGDKIERRDGRRFVLTLVNRKGGVFSADSADGQWSHWGGSIGKIEGPLSEVVEPRVVISEAGYGYVKVNARKSSGSGIPSEVTP